MDIRQLKLELIEKISRCEDEAILQAVAGVLAIKGRNEKGRESAPAATLPPVLANEKQSLGADARDLQRDMDDVFG